MDIKNFDSKEINRKQIYNIIITITEYKNKDSSNISLNQIYEFTKNLLEEGLKYNRHIKVDGCLKHVSKYVSGMYLTLKEMTNDVYKDIDLLDDEPNCLLRFVMITSETEYLGQDRHGQNNMTIVSDYKRFVDAFTSFRVITQEKTPNIIVHDTISTQEVKKIQETVDKKEICNKCNMFYHPPNKCKIDQSKNICNNCGKVGHNKPSCPKLMCHNCGNLGHYSDKCPN